MRKFYIVIVLALLTACSSSSKSEEKITIACSANMQFAIEEIISAFEEKTGITCDLVTGSSGKLTAQILEGAPYDLLVSADTYYPEEIYSSGLSEGKPKVYGKGQLVLWTTNPEIKADLNILTDERIKHIAIANPKTAPYGVAAENVLKELQIYERIKDKLVYGESISQVNQFVSSGSADIGFTAMSAVLSDEMKDMGNWISISDSLYDPIAQAVVVMKGERSEEAQKFVDFLFSEKGLEILVRFGYLVHE